MIVRSRKNLWLLLGLWLGGGAIAREPVTAPRPDWAAEQYALAAPSLSANALQRIRAAGDFYRAATAEAIPEQVEALVQTMEHDPLAAMPLAMLRETLAGEGRLSPEQFERLLRGAEQNPGAKELILSILMWRRDEQDPAILARLRTLAWQLSAALLAQPEAAVSEHKRQQLLAALLNFGNFSCALDETVATREVYLQWLREQPPESGNAALIEAAVLFFSDAMETASERTPWYGGTSERARFQALRAEWFQALRRQEAVAVSPAEVQRRLSTYRYLKEERAAETWLRRQVVVSGNHPDYRYLLAQYLQDEGRLAEARQVWDVLVSDFPEQRELLLKAGDAALENEDFDRAIWAFARLVSRKEDTFLLYRLALALVGKGEYAAAERILAKLPADDLHLTVLRLQTLCALGQLSQAVELAARYELAVDALGGFPDPEEAQAFYLALLLVADAKRDQELVRQCMARFQRYDLFDDPQVCNNVGYVLADMNMELDTAQRLLTFALSREPASPVVLDSMAWLHFRRGNLMDARHYMELAIAALPPEERLTAGVLYDHAGDIFHAAGQSALAAEYWQRALDSGDRALNFTKIKQKLERLRREAATAIPE